MYGKAASSAPTNTKSQRGTHVSNMGSCLKSCSWNNRGGGEARQGLQSLYRQRRKAGQTMERMCSTPEMHWVPHYTYEVHYTLNFKTLLFSTLSETSSYLSGFKSHLPFI
jgi:hypothetical protein